MKDHVAPIPLRFTNALRAEEIDRDQYVLGCYVAALCYEAKNTSSGVATVRLADLAGLFGFEVEHVRRKLRGLAPKWIEAETRSGPNAVWRIRTTGLTWQRDDEDGSPPNLHRISSESTPSEWKLISTEPQSPDAASPHEQRESEPSESPLHDSTATPTRHDTTRDTACSEGTVEPLAVSRPLETVVAVAEDHDLPEPGSDEFVFALLRRYPPGHPERARLLGLHPEEARYAEPGLEDVLEDELRVLVADGVLEPLTTGGKP